LYLPFPRLLAFIHSVGLRETVNLRVRPGGAIFHPEWTAGYQEGVNAWILTGNSKDGGAGISGDAPAFCGLGVE
jgi:hypothetical protein